MAYNSVKLPHPVLGSDDDINGTIGFRQEVILSHTKLQYKLTVECFFQNSELERLLNEGKIEYACQIHCPTTLFLQSEKNRTGEFAILIDKKNISFRVYCSFYLIVSQEILYNNPDAHSDYMGHGFQLEKGSIVGIFSDDTLFDADLPWNDLNNPGNMFNVVLDANNKFATHNFIGNKIDLMLPEEVFKDWKLSYIRKDYKEIFESSYTMSMLTSAIEKCRKANYDDEFDYIPCLWERILNHRLNSDPELLEVEKDEDNYSFLCAQIILKNPYLTMVQRILKIVENI
jgi:hypothetical protein